MIKELGKSGKHHEEKHARDSELEFKIVARRNRVLGLWAAEKLGLSGGSVQAYVKEVVAADFEEPGDDDVVRKVMGDFGRNGVATKRIRASNGDVEASRHCPRASRPRLIGPVTGRPLFRSRPSCGQEEEGARDVL